jgi:uncharacterized membrane protein YfcA
MTTSLEGFVLILSFAISILSGFVGIGGGIVMAPALLYLPPLLGFGQLDMKTVSGLTIAQALAACLSGALRHGKYRYVNRRLVRWMGGSILVSALAGSVASRWVVNEVLMVVFAALALVASVLMLLPKTDGEEVTDADGYAFDRRSAVAIAVGVGFLGGLVGQGGSFLIIPLMLYVLKLPTRVVIGSSLGIVFFSSIAGFAGKLVTGQMPLLPAAAVVAGAIPGAQLGGMLSRRTTPGRLRLALAVMVMLAAVKMGIDVLQMSVRQTGSRSATPGISSYSWISACTTSRLRHGSAVGSPARVKSLTGRAGSLRGQSASAPQPPAAGSPSSMPLRGR